MSAKDAVIEFIRGLPDGLTEAEIVAEAETRFADPDDGPEDWDEAEIAEINRRVAEMTNGAVQGIPHEQVMREARERYG